MLKTFVVIIDTALLADLSRMAEAQRSGPCLKGFQLLCTHSNLPLLSSTPTPVFRTQADTYQILISLHYREPLLLTPALISTPEL